MNIKFDSTPENLIKACAAANRSLSNRLYKRSWLAVPFYGAIALWVGPLLWLAAHGISGWLVPPDTIGYVLALFFAGFGLLMLTTLLGRRRVLHMLSRDKSAMFGPCSVAFNNDKLSYSDPRGRADIPWEWVDNVEDFNGNIIISYGLVYVIQLPVDAFPDMETRRAFREEMINRMAASRGKTSPTI